MQTCVTMRAKVRISMIYHAKCHHKNNWRWNKLGKTHIDATFAWMHQWCIASLSNTSMQTLIWISVSFDAKSQNWCIITAGLRKHTWITRDSWKEQRSLGSRNSSKSTRITSRIYYMSSYINSITNNNVFCIFDRQCEITDKFETEHEHNPCHDSYNDMSL